ncbi:MAG: DUF5655 domain-containing protein [Acidimicrobiales bacterium]
MAWECDDCGRSFGRTGQQHDCRPGVTIDAFLAAALPAAEPIFARVERHLRGLTGGDLIVDPLADKVQFKNGPVFAILGAMKKWTSLGFTVRRRIDSDRFSRKVTEYNGRYYHVLNLTDVEQVDDEVLEWLTEAFLGDAFDGGPVGGDPMVPDDVDIEF